MKQVAQLWQRDRASSIDDFKGWVTLRLNFHSGQIKNFYITTKVKITSIQYRVLSKRRRDLFFVYAFLVFSCF